MSRPAIQSFKLTPKIAVYECHPDSERQFQHWRLWDNRAPGGGHNIVMSAKTKEEALVQAIDYWAKYCSQWEKKFTDLNNKVEAFFNAVHPDEEDEEDNE